MERPHLVIREIGDTWEGVAILSVKDQPVFLFAAVSGPNSLAIKVRMRLWISI